MRELVKFESQVDDKLAELNVQISQQPDKDQSVDSETVVESRFPTQ